MDYLEIHVLQAPISAQTQTDITDSKRDQKNARWRACVDKYRSKKEHRTQDESDLHRNDPPPPPQEFCTGEKFSTSYSVKQQKGLKIFMIKDRH